MHAEDPTSALMSPVLLIERIEAGDREAENTLVSQYWRTLYHILNHRAKAPDLAADITQDAFVVVINKARSGEIHNPVALASFIRQVGINMLIGHYRREQRQKTDNKDGIIASLEDRQAEASASLSKQQAAEFVKQVMDELPTQRDRDLLYRYFIYGQDKKVICSEFEISAEHFDRILYRARNRLKQVIQTRCGVDPSHVSLLHLLSVTIFLCAISANDEINPKSVREPISWLHSSNTFQVKQMAVKDRPSSMLDDVLRQQETRLI